MVSRSCPLDHRSASLLDGGRKHQCGRRAVEIHTKSTYQLQLRETRKKDGQTAKKAKVRTVIQMSHECQEKDDASDGKLRCLQPFRDPFTFRETTPPSDTLLVTPR